MRVKELLDSFVGTVTVQVHTEDKAKVATFTWNADEPDADILRQEVKSWAFDGVTLVITTELETTRHQPYKLEYDGKVYEEGVFFIGTERYGYHPVVSISKEYGDDVTGPADWGMWSFDISHEDLARLDSMGKTIPQSAFDESVDEFADKGFSTNGYETLDELLADNFCKADADYFRTFF